MGAPLNILVIDDESLIRWAISRTLMSAGHSVHEASDAASAIAQLKDCRWMPDVVLLDYRLPGAHGFDLLATVRTLSPTSAVVMMSADQTSDSTAEAVERGAYTVMHKPFDMGALEPQLISASLARPEPGHRKAGG